MTNTASPNVSVFLGNGDGTLQPERVTAVGAPSDGPLRGVGAFGLVVRDVDHDGKQDIVAATTAPDHLELLRGRGDGTFEQPRSFPSPSSLSVFPFALAHGDFNHDGQDDLISGGVGSVTTYDGRKGGTFVPTKTFNLPGLVIAWIDVADVNGDGNDDVVFTGTGTQNVNVMLGNGDGTFRQGENLFSGGVGPQGLDVGDVNGDGRPDISVANTATPAVEGNVAVFLNTGDGRFRQSFSYPAGLSPFTTSFADFDGDGAPDLLSAIGAPSQVSIARGRGDGTFEPRAIYGM